MPGRLGRTIVAGAAVGAVTGSRQGPRGRRSPGVGGGAAQGGEGDQRYQLQQRMLAIGDDFRITDERGEIAFVVDGKAIRVRSTLRFLDPDGTERYLIQQKLARVRDSMSVQRPDGSVAARVHQALIAPLRDRWTIDVPGGEALHVTGNILDHEYRIERAGTPVATVSRRWFRVRDNYGVEVARGEDVALFLALAVVVDVMVHEGR
jgi:uncharacterized protein YxjI